MAVDYLSAINSGGSGLNITQIVDSLVDAEKAPQENIIQTDNKEVTKSVLFAESDSDSDSDQL